MESMAYPYVPQLKTAEQMRRDGGDRFFINPCDITAGFTFTRVAANGTVVTLTETGNKWQRSGDGRRATFGLPKPLLSMTSSEMVDASAVEPWDAANSSTPTA